MKKKITISIIVISVLAAIAAGIIFLGGGFKKEQRKTESGLPAAKETSTVYYKILPDHSPFKEGYSADNYVIASSRAINPDVLESVTKESLKSDDEYLEVILSSGGEPVKITYAHKIYSLDGSENITTESYDFDRGGVVKWSFYRVNQFAQELEHSYSESLKGAGLGYRDVKRIYYYNSAYQICGEMESETLEIQKHNSENNEIEHERTDEFLSVDLTCYLKQAEVDGLVLSKEKTGDISNPPPSLNPFKIEIKELVPLAKERSSFSKASDFPYTVIISTKYFKNQNSYIKGTIKIYNRLKSNEQAILTYSLADNVLLLQ
jgi:hypothetical protein